MTGPEFRQLREANGLQQADVARGIVNPGTLSRFERGQRPLSRANRDALLTKLERLRRQQEERRVAEQITAALLELVSLTGQGRRPAPGASPLA